MMTFSQRILPLLGGAVFMAHGLLATGCLTYTDQRTRTTVQEREDWLLLQEDIRRVTAQMEGLEMELERLQRDVGRLRQEWRDDGQTRHAAQTQQLQELDARIRAVDQAREKDKREIVQQLSGTVEQLIQQQNRAARQTTTARPSHSGYGYEHVVQAGETLSHIAAAYGVTGQSIINANNLENPDRLRIGQTLFIPE